MIRAIRLELVKPLDEPWEVVGPLLRTLAKVTPKLLNAAMDARIAIDVAGRDAVKIKIAPDAKASSGDGLAYQAVLREVEMLREWGAKKKHPWKDLEIPGGMASSIARAASQAFAERDRPGKGRVAFASERIIVRGDGVAVSRDASGAALSLKLRSKGSVRFALAHSRGDHHDTIAAIASKVTPHGDVKLQWDERRRKWYALLSYTAQPRVHAKADPDNALVVHRGVRNALYLLSSTGQSKSLPGAKFVAQRRALQARSKDAKRISPHELGEGAKGHGRARRYEHYETLQDKIARVTHTFCQQSAAYVAARAIEWGCGTVIIEDYGGIAPSEDAALRRVLDRFPLYEMKQCIVSRLDRDGLALRETPSAFISTTCPRCEHCEPRNHNTRTGMFRCCVCFFERPADWVAAFWMLDHGGGDMTIWRKRLQRERELRELAESMRGDDRKEAAE